MRCSLFVVCWSLFVVCCVLNVVRCLLCGVCCLLIGVCCCSYVCLVFFIYLFFFGGGVFDVCGLSLRVGGWLLLVVSRLLAVGCCLLVIDLSLLLYVVGSSLSIVCCWLYVDC